MLICIIFRVVGLCLMCVLVLVLGGVVCGLLGVVEVLMMRGWWVGRLDVVVWLAVGRLCCGQVHELVYCCMRV